MFHLSSSKKWCEVFLFNGKLWPDSFNITCEFNKVLKILRNPRRDTQDRTNLKVNLDVHPSQLNTTILRNYTSKVIALIFHLPRSRQGLVRKNRKITSLLSSARGLSNYHHNILKWHLRASGLRKLAYVFPLCTLWLIFTSRTAFLDSANLNLHYLLYLRRTLLTGISFISPLTTSFNLESFSQPLNSLLTPLPSGRSFNSPWTPQLTTFNPI